MPKFRFTKSKRERKIKIAVDVSVDDNKDSSKQSIEANFPQIPLDEINTFNAIATLFPKIIQKILLFLPHSSHKLLRFCNKSLKQAVDHYVGLSIIVSETRTEYDVSNKIQIINKELLNALKHVGIRCLKGVQLARTQFSDILTFPYLLQSIHLFGQFDQHILLELLRHCWNLRTLKLQEPNQFHMQIRGDFLDYMRSVGSLLEKRKVVRLDHLKNLKIYCSTTSTMGYVLVLLSAVEAKSLETLHCCIGPVHANFYALITGLIVHLINKASSTLQDFWLVVESSDAYPEITAKRRFLRKLAIFNEECSEMLPKFEETFRKLYLSDEERDKWLQDILSKAGEQCGKLSKVRLDIDTMEDFTNNWIHFLKKQHSLTTLELQACCHWSLVANIIKQNAKTLDALGLIMEFHAPMDLEALLRDCTKLKRLILKNFDFQTPEELVMRRIGHLTNAKFDELFPQLENLALSNLLIRSNDLSRVCKMSKLKDFVLSLLELDPDNGDFSEPENMFGLLQQDFWQLLHHRNMNHLVVSTEAIVSCGSLQQRLQDEKKLELLIEDPMFHTTNILGWHILSLDEEHIAVAHGDTVTTTDWIFPLIISVIEDTLEADVISLRSLICEDDGC